MASPALSLWQPFGLRSSPFFQDELKPSATAERPISLFVGRRREVERLIVRCAARRSSAEELEARFGRYIHDVDDVLGWRAAPILIGGVAGAGLGLYSPERLQGAVIYGAIGLGLGALGGMAVGNSIWDPPEGRWAAAAIGAGIGLIVGNTIGILNPVNVFTESDEATAAGTAGVPIVFRISL